MRLKRQLERELRLMLCKPGYVIVSCVVTVTVGILTWLSCDGISIIWRLSKHPAISIPLPLMFVLWIAAYFLYGLLISMCVSCGIGSSLCRKAAVSYLATLFWCPLTLISRGFICSTAAVVLSLVYLLMIVKVLIRHSLVAAFSVSLITVYQIYILCFSVPFTLLN